MKTCTKCGETKDFSEFHKCKNNKDGLLCWCKKCFNNRRKEIKFNSMMQLEKEIASSIRIENKILLQDGKKICGGCKQIFKIDDIGIDGYCSKCKTKIQNKYKLANKERVKESKKKWYEENKEKVSEYQKKWYEENKEEADLKRKEYKKEYRCKNKETIRRWYDENLQKVKEYQKQYRLKKKLEKLQQN